MTTSEKVKMATAALAAMLFLFIIPVFLLSNSYKEVQKTNAENEKILHNLLISTVETQNFFNQREDAVKSRLGNDVKLLSQEGGTWIALSQGKQYVIVFEDGKTAPSNISEIKADQTIYKHEI